MEFCSVIVYISEFHLLGSFVTCGKQNNHFAAVVCLHSHLCASELKKYLKLGLENFSKNFVQS